MPGHPHGLAAIPVTTARTRLDLGGMEDAGRSGPTSAGRVENMTWIIDYVIARADAEGRRAGTPGWVMAIVSMDTGEILNTSVGVGIPDGAEAMRIVMAVAERVGVPGTILTDSRWVFSCGDFQSALKALGITHQYKPWVTTLMRALLP